MGLEQVHLRHDERFASRYVRGTAVSVTRTKGPVVETESDKHNTAYHEACHVLVAMLVGVAVHEATNIPGPGYGGYTKVSRYDTTVAAAAEAMGCSGTGHDLWSITEAGVDPNHAVRSARSLLSGRDIDLRAIATAIEQNGLVTGRDIATHHERLAHDLVSATITHPDGTTTTEYQTAHATEVQLRLPPEDARTVH